MKRDRECKVHTFGRVAGLVVLAEVVQILVLDPGHPVLVLVVVCISSAFHVCDFDLYVSLMM